jgi:hypothetical protein
MALGSTQPLTELSSRRSFWAVKGGWSIRLKNLIAVFEQIV